MTHDRMTREPVRREVRRAGIRCGPVRSQVQVWVARRVGVAVARGSLPGAACARSRRQSSETSGDCDWETEVGGREGQTQQVRRETHMEEALRMTKHKKLKKCVGIPIHLSYLLSRPSGRDSTYSALSRQSSIHRRPGSLAPGPARTSTL